MVKCSHCGKENLNEAEFCQNCGKRVKDPFFRVPSNKKSHSKATDYKIPLALVAIIVVIIAALVLLNLPKPQLTVINPPILANDTYNNGSISFNYPKNWVSIDNQTQNTIVALGDPASKTNTSYTTYIALFKEKQPLGQNLKNTFESTYKKLQGEESTFQIVNNRTISVNGRTAYEITYQKEVNNELLKERSVWVDVDGFIYILTLSTRSNDFENQTNNFNLVVGSFTF